MSLNQQDIERAIENFQLPAEEEKEAAALHQKFLARYPLEKLRSLTLQEYALGITNPPDSTEPESRGLCWWIEFGTEKLGKIRGAVAFKHIVFFDVDEKVWKYKGYASEQEAFNAAKSGLLKVLDLAQNDRFGDIDSVAPFQNQNLTRGKYLYLYFPDKFLPVYSPDDLRTFCHLLHVPISDNASTTETNRALVRFRESHPVLSQWTNWKFMKFLYSTFHPHERFWKIAPGEKAHLWEDCRRGGYICVGWQEMGDLAQYKDRPSFNEAFEKHFPGGRAAQLWNFRGIAEGDYIIANNGEKEIVGVGVVTGKYYFNAERTTYQNCFPVKWLRTDPYPVPRSPELRINWRNTIDELSRREFEILTAPAAPATSGLVWKRVTSSGYDLQLESTTGLHVQAISSKFDEMLKSRTLLSGEPYLNADFRDSFAAWLNDPSKIFPAVCIAVLSNWFLTSLGTEERKRVAGELWDLLFRCRPLDRLTDPGKMNILAESFENWWERQVELQGGRKSEPLIPVLRSYDELCRQTFLPESFFADCEELLNTRQQIILQGPPGSGKTFVAEQLASWWAGAADRVSLVQFHESYGYEDFIHGIRPEHDSISGQTMFTSQDGTFLKFCRRAEQDRDRNYVLIIDEINRAKTARVFGELLYLLEYRRKEITLQYGQNFAIPPNLFIIGTMNTVDRSIALVDYALRRRFAFLTLYPVLGDKSTVLGPWMQFHKIDNHFEVERVFVELNRLVSKQDENLMVGHSYFMADAAVKERHFSDQLLSSIWRYYIMPLVAEYEYQLGMKALEKKYGLETIRQTLQNATVMKAEA